MSVLAIRPEGRAIATCGQEKRVVHLLDAASRSNGGVFESAIGIAESVAALDGWGCSAIAPEDESASLDQHRWSKTTLRLAAPGLSRMVGPVRSFARLAASEAPDVMHLHGIWGCASRAAARLAADPTSVPYLISPHGMLDQWALQQSATKKRLARRIWVDRLLAGAHCLHALNVAEARSIATAYPDSPVVIVPNGVSLPDSVGYNPATAEKSILFLGRIHPKKGVEELVEGWMRSGLAARGWCLDIAGWDDGGHEKRLRRKVEASGLCSSVRFHGPAFGAEKDALFRRAAFFVLPSYSEGLPMAVLEAWSYGLPVLMTEQCNLPSGFEEKAALECKLEPENIAALLVSLAIDMTEYERCAMGTRGRALVERCFSWAVVALQFAEVYGWMLGGAPPDCLAGQPESGAPA